MSESSSPRRVVVGLSGASGAIYGIRLIEVLAAMEGVETHLVMSKGLKRPFPMRPIESPATLRLSPTWFTMSVISPPPSPVGRS